MVLSERSMGRLATVALVGAALAAACGGTSSLDFPGTDSGLGGADDGGPARFCLLEGETTCEGRCTPLRSDPTNCGGCGISCGGQTPLCNVGSCSSSCNPELTVCKSGCVDLATDVHDCGACGATCAESQSCTGGQCMCAGGSMACAGACVDARTDASNCGACGVVCKGSTPFCSQGFCTASCVADLTACDRACVDTLTSARNCGACNRPCLASATCSAGTCSCAANLTSCAGQCVDTRTNAAHCGGCDLPCATGLACRGGRCVP